MHTEGTTFISFLPPDLAFALGMLAGILLTAGIVIALTERDERRKAR